MERAIRELREQNRALVAGQKRMQDAMRQMAELEKSQLQQR
jgi:hypothetical protein